MRRHRFLNGWAMKAFCAFALAIAVASSCTSALASTGGQVGVTTGTTSTGGGELVVYGTTTPFHVRGFTSLGVIFPWQYSAKNPSDPYDLCYNALEKTYNDRILETDLYNVGQTMTGSLSDTNKQLHGMQNDYNANTIRLQVSQGALQYEYANGLSAYTDMVLGVVNAARAQAFVVIVSMQTEFGADCTPQIVVNGVTQDQKLPDYLTEQAWAQLLGNANWPTNDRAVILEVFNESVQHVQCGGTGLNWTYWATGCPSGNPGTSTNQGMVTVGNYLRSLAPDNLLIFDADNEGTGSTLYGLTPSSLSMPSNSAFTVHPFNYVDGQYGSGGDTGWDARFGNFEAAGNALTVTAWSESYKCDDPGDTGGNAYTLINTYLPAMNIGMMVTMWDAPPSNDLVGPYPTFTPNLATYKTDDPTVTNCPTFTPVPGTDYTGSTLAQTWFVAQ